MWVQKQEADLGAHTHKQDKQEWMKVGMKWKKRAQVGDANSCKGRQHDGMPSCLTVLLLQMLLVWECFEAAVCNPFFIFWWTRSTNKQLASRKGARYFRGQNPKLTKSRTTLVCYLFCLFWEAKSHWNKSSSESFGLILQTAGNIWKSRKVWHRCKCMTFNIPMRVW